MTYFPPFSPFSCVKSGMVLPLSSWAAHSRHTIYCGLALVVAAEYPDDHHGYPPTSYHPYQSQTQTCRYFALWHLVLPVGGRRAPGTHSESRDCSRRQDTHFFPLHNCNHCCSSPHRSRRPAYSCSKRQPSIICRCAGQWQCKSGDCSRLGNSCRCTWPLICSCGRVVC